MRPGHAPCMDQSIHCKQRPLLALPRWFASQGRQSHAPYHLRHGDRPRGGRPRWHFFFQRTILELRHLFWDGVNTSFPCRYYVCVWKSCSLTLFTQHLSVPFSWLLCFEFLYSKHVLTFCGLTSTLNSQWCTEVSLLYSLSFFFLIRSFNSFTCFFFCE
jgi:hypothetical protein